MRVSLRSSEASLSGNLIVLIPWLRAVTGPSVPCVGGVGEPILGHLCSSSPPLQHLQRHHSFSFLLAF